MVIFLCEIIGKVLQKCEHKVRPIERQKYDILNKYAVYCQKKMNVIKMDTCGEVQANDMDDLYSRRQLVERRSLIIAPTKA